MSQTSQTSQTSQSSNPRENIRNFSIIAHVDHGKSSLADTLCRMGGLGSEDDVGTKRVTDTRDDEKERGITIKSTGVSFKMEGYTFNFIDSPGHADFNSEVTAALRVTDGALVIVDAVEGVCVQTETVLRQALMEQLKVVLVINKLDRFFFDLNLDAETAYQRLSRIIEAVNVIIQSYRKEDEGDTWAVSPEKGNVFFACGLHGWGFGLKHFASRLCKTTKTSETKMMDNLWGDHFFDPVSRKILTKLPEIKSTESVDEKNKPKRMFNQLIYQPIYDIYRSIMDKDVATYNRLLVKHEINLSKDESELEEKKLFKIVMKKMLPLSKALFDAIVNHLPSPVVAQSYRVNTLYDGPMDDAAARAIKTCDPNGPLMMFVSKMIPMPDAGRFYAFGRIFSGTIKQGQKITIMGSNFVHGKKDDLSVDKTVSRIVTMVANKIEPVDEACCGSTVALVGVDQYLVKSGTITNLGVLSSSSSSSFSDGEGKETKEVAEDIKDTKRGIEDLYPIKTMKLSVSPVVRVAVSVAKSSDLQKLSDGMKKLKTTDLCVLCYQSDDGEHIIAGAGELHIEICLKDLRDFMKGTEIIVSKPTVPFRETVTELSKVCLSKSPNNHNRMFMTAEPLGEELTLDIENKKFDIKDAKTSARYLVEHHDWDPVDAKKIWAYGPINEESNILLDASKGLSNLSEIKQHVVNAFYQFTHKGVLCNEPIRGVLFKMVDAHLHPDTIHRGAGQLEPATRRALTASFLCGVPKLGQPIFKIDISVTQDHIGTVYSCLSQRGGSVVNEVHTEGTSMNVVTGHLPVLNSFDFDSYLRGKTGGQAFSQCVFDHWEAMGDDPLDPDTRVNKVIQECRVRKNLKPDVPPLQDFLDKL